MLTSRRTRWAPALSALADGSGEGGLAADEAVMMTMLLLVAGHETTANLIGNAVAALHSHLGTARQLRRDPDRLPVAVEEFLRHDSPVQLASRVAARDTALGDAVVRKGRAGAVATPPSRGGTP
jgi:cytochrome P450